MYACFPAPPAPTYKHTLTRSDTLTQSRVPFLQGRLIVRNLRFDATPQHIMNACLRCGDIAAAAAITHIHVPVKPGSPLPPPPRLLVAVSAGPARAQLKHKLAVGTAAAARGDGEEGADEEERAEDASSVEGAGEEEEDANARDDGVGGSTEESVDGAVSAAAGPKYRNRGFAFVEFATRAAAQSALDALNGHKVHRREVVADWALSQEAFTAAAAAAAATPASAPDDALSGGEEDTGAVEDGDAEGDADAADAEEGAATTSDAGEDGDFEGEVESTGEQEADEEEEEEDEGEPRSKADTVEAGTTLFVQNLPFDTTSEQLKSVMSPFGGVRYAQIVMDHALGRSKGSGFVQFYEAAAAERAMTASMTGPEAEVAAESISSATLGGAPAERARRQRQVDAVLSCIRGGGILRELASTVPSYQACKRSC
jgi:hypothetical protein